MENPFFHRLGRALWAGAVILVVLLAAYVCAGRLLTSTMGAYRASILHELNTHLPFTLEARSLSGEWHSFSPVIVLSGLSVHIPGSSEPPLRLAQGRIGVDVLNSVRTGVLQPTRVVLSGLNLQGELTANGRFLLSGLGEESGGSTGPLREFLLNVERVSLQDNHLRLSLPSGEVRDLGLDLQLSRAGSQRRVAATLTSTAGARITVSAQGLGDPFQPEHFTGQIYVHAETAHLGAMQAMFANRSPAMWADGAAELELWLDWDKGQSAIAARFTGTDLQVTVPGSSAQMPLQRIAFEARALRHDEDWSVFFQNLQFENDGNEVNIPRLQLDRLGNSLRLRTADVALAPVTQLLAQQQAVPENLRELIKVLQPRGGVSALQLQLNDIGNTSSQWELAANFEDLAVDSWHGAPGIRAATGYTRLSPGKGIVVLDSPGLSLDFPTVYQQPLQYEDMFGSLALNWDSETFNLRSGLLTTRGEEGTAKVLFSLAVPLQPSDIGIEMDLLVGLQDSHPVHRSKYIPYILDDSLRSWLARSLGEGHIEQGAFLWRGSLKSHAAALRTVQLAFNVTDTQLAFHPRWPPVLVREGIVLIDDSKVSVWAERASLLESTAENLSVETRESTEGHLTLDLHGTVHGPAADGFKVLNESPLADVVGSGFSAWTASGNLDTELDLHLDLKDSSVGPRVDVITHWHDVDLLVMPGKLPIEEVNGEFTYSTTTGFSSKALTGTLWGKPVNADVGQQFGAGTDHYDPTSSIVQIHAATTVDFSDVQRWLQLQSLSFANGETAADVNIQLVHGAAPQLSVSSELQGVSLDLPKPWHKEATEAWPFDLQVPLQQGSMPLRIELAQQFAFDLDIADGAVRGASVGINEPPMPVRQGELHVTGKTALIQVDEWFHFVSQYYGRDPLQALAGAVSTDADAEVDAAVATDVDAGPDNKPTSTTRTSTTRTEPPAPTPLAIFIENLRADELVILRQSLRNVTLNLDSVPAQWQLSVATEWLASELIISRTGEPARLEIAHLDLDRLPDFQPTAEGVEGGEGEEPPWNLPTVQVSVAELSQSGQRLGALHFDLSSQDNVVAADNISGELAHLHIRPDAPGRLLWHRGQSAYTELRSGFEFANLGETLAYFDYERILETQHGELDLQLRWPGAPQDFSLRNSEGELQAKIGKGSFLEATTGASGALRVVSILNLADIVRRLSLSPMFESGIPFDSVAGNANLQDGKLKVARMDVRGGSSFQFSGESDLQTRDVNGELVAKLPITQNLPWIAAFAASLPVAAGVYVISQVFDKQMNRLASAVYTIGGTWNDPTVNFDRIYDNTPEQDAQPAEQSAEPDQSSSP